MMSYNLYKLQLVKMPGEFTCTNKGNNSPYEIASAFEEVFHLSTSAEEQFCMFCLDTKNKVIGAHVVSQGTLNRSFVHPREIFKRAIVNNANAVIFGHNHISGDTTPSNGDCEMTKRLMEVGDLIGIKVLDHLILSPSHEHPGYVYRSMLEEGDLI